MSKKRTDLLSVAKKEMKDNPYLKRLCNQEELILDVIEELLKILSAKKMSKKDLAKKLSFSEKFLNEFLFRDGHMSIRFVSDAFFVLGYKLKIKVVKDK